jgi:hypothetical protein
MKDWERTGHGQPGLYSWRNARNLLLERTRLELERQTIKANKHYIRTSSFLDIFKAPAELISHLARSVERICLTG